MAAADAIRRPEGYITSWEAVVGGGGDGSGAARGTGGGAGGGGRGERMGAKRSAHGGRQSPTAHMGMLLSGAACATQRGRGRWALGPPPQCQFRAAVWSIISGEISWGGSEGREQGQFEKKQIRN